MPISKIFSASRPLLPLLALFLLAAPLHAADTAPLKLGIMPFNSTLALIRTHQPLADFLGKRLGRTVEILTSPGYKEFVEDSRAAQFDLLITGPHFGVMARDAGYQPLFRYKATLQPIFVVRPEAGIDRAERLRGKRIALSSSFSISSTGGLRWLEEQGVPLAEVTIEEKTTHGAAIAAVAVGDADAALTTYTPLKQVPPDVAKQVTVFASGLEIPHLMTLAHQRLGAAEIDKVRAALKEFAESAPEGKAFFDETGYKGYEPVSDQDIAALQPYVEIVKSLLKE